MGRGIGVEIGATAIRAAVVERRGAVTRLVACAELPWSGSGAHALAAALGGMKRLVPWSGPVVVGMPTSAAIVTTVEPLIVEPAHAEAAIRFELQQRLPYEVAQAVWSYHWWADEGRAVVAAMKQTLAEERLAAFRQAGVSAAALQVSAMAAVNAWRATPAGATPSATVLLHLDGAEAEWVLIGAHGVEVVAGGMLPTGGAGPGALDLQQPAVLETLKSSWASVQAHARAAGVVSSGAPMIVVVDGVPTGPDATGVLAQALGCAVQRLATESMVTVDEAQRSSADRMAIATGLALQAVGAARWPLNVLAQRLLQQQVARAGRIAATISACALAFALLGVARGMAGMVGARQRLVQHLAEQERLYQQLRPEVRRLRERQAVLELRLRELDRLALLQGHAEHAFGRVVQALPETVWLTTAVLTKTNALEGTLEGRARSFQGVTQLMERLKAAGWETVRPLSTTVVTDPATGAEQIAFAVKVQQPLPALQELALTDATLR